MFEPINPYVRDQMVTTFGYVSGTASATAFPSVPAQYIRFKANAANKAPFYIGELASCRFELSAGEDTGWSFVQNGNLNAMAYKNASGSSEILAYWAMY